MQIEDESVTWNPGGEAARGVRKMEAACSGAGGNGAGSHHLPHPHQIFPTELARGVTPPLSWDGEGIKHRTFRFRRESYGLCTGEGKSQQVAGRK